MKLNCLDDDIIRFAFADYGISGPTYARKSTGCSIAFNDCTIPVKAGGDYYRSIIDSCNGRQSCVVETRAITNGLLCKGRHSGRSVSDYVSIFYRCVDPSASTEKYEREGMYMASQNVPC